MNVMYILAMGVIGVGLWLATTVIYDHTKLAFIDLAFGVMVIGLGAMLIIITYGFRDEEPKSYHSTELKDGRT